MSTRVHELAKELGLKGKDLLERIQQAGIEVKNSVFAGLDDEQAEQVRKLFKGGSISTQPTLEPSAPPSPSKPAPAPPAAPSGPAVSPPVSATPEPSPPPTPPAPAPARTTPAAPPMAAQAPSSAPVSSAPPQAGPGGGNRPQPQQGGSQRPANPPISRVSGPLSHHTPHRTTRPTDTPTSSGQPPTRPMSQPPTQSSAGAGSNRAVERSDYISPHGTRGPSSGRPQTIAPPVRRSDAGGGGPERRSEGGAGGSDRRSEGAAAGPRPGSTGGGRPLPSVGGGGRPLPPVATPGGGPRRPEGPRPSPLEGKIQRPEKKYTPEELFDMMRRGRLGTQNAGPAAPAGPGAPRQGGGPTGPAALRPRPDGPRGPGGITGPAGLRGPGAPPMPPPVEDDDRRGKPGPGGVRPGGAADREGRRARRTERVTDRKSTLSSPMPAAALLDFDDEGRRIRGPKKHKHGRATIAPRKSSVTIVPPVSVRDLSESIGVKANELMRKMMQTTGQLVTINTVLDDETSQMLALEFGIELTISHVQTAEDTLLAEVEEAGESTEGLEPRAPIVTILGHVDHGKTSLLDRIRRTNVVAGESGGITQHIGAYQVEHEGRKITFVDTPGHEAFTAMRARGANVTDIAVLVVAADDGVMPQTIEAISHAKAAEVPIIVALNKVDLPNVNYNKIFGELSQQGLVPEEYGGETLVVKTSASTGLGIPELLESIGLVADLHELKSNPNRPAVGTCLEASRSEGRGVLATVLVQDGTLKVGDVMVCGDSFGRVRALFDDQARPINEAGPSTPVEISGLDEVPTAGERFLVLDDISKAREIAEARRDRTRGATIAESRAITLENLYSRMAEKKLKTLNLILKADVQGSLEALTKELQKLENVEVPIRVLLKAVGGITESDVILADASEAIIIGFRVAPEDRAVSMAEEKGIEIRRYDIIYQVTDEIKKAVEGRLAPEIKEVHLGRAVVRQIFKITKVGNVAGCFVTQGTIERNAEARIIRDGREIYKGSIEALKRFKDDAKEVREGFECGIKISRFDDLKSDDVIEAYRIDTIQRTL